MAYAIGLLTTDGNLSPDGRHIAFISKDLEQINTFRKCLRLKNKVGTRNSGFKKDSKSFHVQFGDVTFYNWLLEVGLTPNKSKTIGKLMIPDRYFFDFLRGHLDGDGCISAYWDKRWLSSYMFYVRFTSASLKHIEWLKETICRLAGIDGKIRHSRGLNELAFAKRTSRILFDKMYYSENIPLLRRKLLKLKEAFKIDSSHSIARVAELVDAHV